MKEFTVQDITVQAARDVVCWCASLKTSLLYFEGICEAIRAKNLEGAWLYAKKLIATAVPIVDDPHPQRARIEVYMYAEGPHDYGYAFNMETPGQVELIMSFNEVTEAWTLFVDFHRDSQYLAAHMLGSLVLGDHKLPNSSSLRGLFLTALGQLWSM